MIKKFLKENTHLRLDIQHLGIFSGGWLIRIINTTWDRIDPIFEHFITDFDVEHSNVDFETIIMTPVINWWEEKKREQGR